jgi:pimeloyl-ACP methyl ester carboxylesterase
MCAATRRSFRCSPGCCRRSTPVTLVNGRHDRVVPLTNAEFLHERLPNSRLVVVDAGHFVWEEAPAEYAAAILEAIR